MLCKQAMEKWCDAISCVPQPRILSFIFTAACVLDGRSDSLSTSQKIAQHALNGLRIWVFLPTMQLTIMTLVVFNGGDGSLSHCLKNMTVCFNTAFFDMH